MDEMLLHVENVTKFYGKTAALKGLNLDVEAGKFIGLLGPNGSGKTTLLKMVAGVLTPSAGDIRIAGCPVGKASKAMVSYLPDTDYLPDRPIVETVDVFSDFFADFDRAKAMSMLQDLHLDPRLSPKKLSKGNREKLQLVMAMSRRAKLYLLDEPIGGIDPAARDYILHTILENYSEDASVILSTHLIGDIESVLDDCIFLREGRLMAHRDAEELRNSENMSVDAYFREVYKC